MVSSKKPSFREVPAPVLPRVGDSSWSASVGALGFSTLRCRRDSDSVSQLNRGRDSMLSDSKPFAFAAVGITLGLAKPLPASATIVFDNFAPGNSYNTAGGYPESADIINGFQFAPSASGFFSSLTIALSGDGSAIPGEVNVYQNNAGQPGAILETLNLIVSTPLGTNNAPVVVAANGSTFLDSSLLYWLVPFSPTGAPFFWNQGHGSAGLGAFGPGVNGPWTIVFPTQGAFRVEVADAVPEPSTRGLIGLGLLGLSAMRRRRLRAH
jgi:PEP-CTERM motif